METIYSTDNNRIKNICKLRNKKYRYEFNRYITEGYRNVKDSLPFLKNVELFIAESMSNKFSEEFPNAVVCEDKVFEKMTDTENSQGIIAVSDIPENVFDNERNCMFLDRISDPGNMGTILRSCLATGFDNVVNFNGVDVYNSKVVRSAMSAICKLNIINGDINIFKQLKGNGYKIVCADMNGTNLFDIKNDFGKICLVIGNEANGICSEIMNIADYVVSLPMGKIESLNAAVCASVIMYQLKYNKQ